jgi:hypothetical protein
MKFHVYFLSLLVFISFGTADTQDIMTISSSVSMLPPITLMTADYDMPIEASLALLCKKLACCYEQPNSNYRFVLLAYSERPVLFFINLLRLIAQQAIITESAFTRETLKLFESENWLVIWKAAMIAADVKAPELVTYLCAHYCATVFSAQQPIVEEYVKEQKLGYQHTEFALTMSEEFKETFFAHLQTSPCLNQIKEYPAKLS